MGCRVAGGLLLIALAGCAELGVDLGRVLAQLPGQAGALDERSIAAGLREALRVGSEQAALQTSRSDGYWGNPLLRIALPQQLEEIAGGLRRFGFARQVDEFERTLNRAAERAAGEAAPVFLAAISQLTISDALGILRGPDDAATQYLRRSSGRELEQRFSPIVGEKLRELGVVRLYEDLVRPLSTLPLGPVPSLDLRAYVTERAVDGLFVVVASEEQKIRTDPAARITELLRRVFR